MVSASYNIVIALRLLIFMCPKSLLDILVNGVCCNKYMNFYSPPGMVTDKKVKEIKIN